MKSAKISLAVLFVFSLFVPSHFVHADAAPPPAPQLGGLEPFRYQETNVQMVYERVEMELRPFFYSLDDFSRTRVDVTAYFIMHNQGDAPESMQAVFPLESFTNCEAGAELRNNYTYYFVNAESFEVMIDGRSVLIQEVETQHPHEGCDKMTWAGFDVTFPVDEDVLIRVQYRLESADMDFMQNIEYILETGAGWAGPIKRGTILVKFPYEATRENVLAESTPGYQFLYNEIYWSFEDLEPTSEDNLRIAIVSPATWQEILLLRQELKVNPALPEKWIKLAQDYELISTSKYVRNTYYYKKVPVTYEQGIAANPNSAVLHSAYAQYIINDCCLFSEKEIKPAQEARVLALANKALALDEFDEGAMNAIGFLLSRNPNLTFTPPATLPPTTTPLFTETPSVTPSSTLTYMPNDMPIIVTVVQTELVSLPTSTPKPTARPTVTSTPTEVPALPENRNETSEPLMIVGALAVFAAGIGAGTFWQKRRGK